MENLISPIQLKLSELQEKIENIKHVERISEEVQLLKKKLAWSSVYDVDEQLQKQRENIEKLKNRIPTCQAKIDSTLDKLEKLQECFLKKKRRQKPLSTFTYFHHRELTSFSFVWL